MKNFILTVVFIMTLTTTVFAHSRQHETIKINGATTEISNMQNMDGVVTAPLKDLAKELGAELTWDMQKQRVHILCKNRYAIIEIGNTVMAYGSYSITESGEIKIESTEILELPIAPTLTNGSTIVPIRLAEKAFNCEVAWENDTVHIKKKGPCVGHKIEDFNLFTSANGNLKLSDYRGEKILVTFWISDYEDSIKQLDILDKLNRDNIKVIAINLGKDDTEKGRQNILKTKEYKFDICLDYTNYTVNLYNISKMPIMYLIDENGTVIDIMNEYMTLKELRSLLDKHQ